MIANIAAAANVLRTNADLLGRHGYTVATLIATLVVVANRTEYNGADHAIRSLAARIAGVAEGVDAANGVFATGSARTGLVVTVPVGADTAEANALHRVVTDLLAVA
jgi:hypothetical protein